MKFLHPTPTRDIGPLANHIEALDCPRGFEQPIVAIARALRRYGECHAARYESPIGEDGIMGDAWLRVAHGLVELLNGETGRLDCGTVDGSVRNMAREFGFLPSEADTLTPDGAE